MAADRDAGRDGDNTDCGIRRTAWDDASEAAAGAVHGGSCGNPAAAGTGADAWAWQARTPEVVVLRDPFEGSSCRRALAGRADGRPTQSRTTRDAAA